jgi:hypothetical protein
MFLTVDIHFGLVQPELMLLQAGAIEPAKTTMDHSCRFHSFARGRRTPSGRAHGVTRLPFFSSVRSGIFRETRGQKRKAASEMSLLMELSGC